MSAFEDSLEKVQSLINSLTWKKIAMFSVLTIIIGFSVAIFENRNAVYNFVSPLWVRDDIPSSKRTLSKNTMDHIDAIVRKSDLVVAIQVTLVDFQRNTRTVTYTSIDDPGLRGVYAEFEKSRVPVEVPLFTADIINNKRVVDLVNGEFICNPYKETIAATLVPESTKYIVTLCANSVPPYYGRFSGILGVYLKREPTKIEIEQIRNVSTTLGLVIFNNDLR